MARALDYQPDQFKTRLVRLNHPRAGGVHEIRKLGRLVTVAWNEQLMNLILVIFCDPTQAITEKIWIGTPNNDVNVKGPPPGFRYVAFVRPGGMIANNQPICVFAKEES